MLPETENHLREHGFVAGETSVRQQIADRCRELLLAKPVGTADPDEIQAKAIIVAEDRYTILGQAEEEVEADLDRLITPLVSGTGLVQDGLENGYVLCAAPVSRKLGNNGDGSITIKRRGRFVSDNPDAIEQYFWTPAAARLATAMAGVRHRLELGTRRQPLLAQRQQPLIAKAHEQMTLELPLKTGMGS